MQNSGKSITASTNSHASSSTITPATTYRPNPALPPYVRQQNEAMGKFAAVWNQHFSGEPSRQIHPPKMQFTAPEQFLEEFTKSPLDITTLSGDWPFPWAYYDEPSNREALLLGRTAHNQLLAAECIYAGLSLNQGFQNYPTQKFEDAWKADVWPDHGWGGNHGLLTDQVYHDYYARSKTLSDQILGGVGSEMASRAARHQTIRSRLLSSILSPGRGLTRLNVNFVLRRVGPI